MAYILELYGCIHHVYLTFHISLLQLHSKGATLGPPYPILTAGKEKVKYVESILRHC